MLPGSPLNPLRGSQCAQTPGWILFPNSWKRIFFFLANALNSSQSIRFQDFQISYSLKATGSWDRLNEDKRQYKNVYLGVVRNAFCLSDSRFLDPTISQVEIGELLWFFYIDSKNVKLSFYILSWGRLKMHSTNHILRFLNQLYLKSNRVD